jgi:hypothetical protein
MTMSKGNKTVLIKVYLLNSLQFKFLRAKKIISAFDAQVDSNYAAVKNGNLLWTGVNVICKNCISFVKEDGHSISFSPPILFTINAYFAFPRTGRHENTIYQ